METQSINKDLSKLFAELLVKNIKDEFKLKHVSMQLADTIVVYETDKGYNVEIPADKYDIWKFLYEGVVIPTNNGSYANTVDIYKNLKVPQPHTNTHKNYVSRCIEKTLKEFPDVVKNNYRGQTNLEVAGISQTKPNKNGGNTGNE